MCVSRRSTVAVVESKTARRSPLAVFSTGSDAQAYTPEASAAGFALSAANTVAMAPAVRPRARKEISRRVIRILPFALLACGDTDDRRQASPKPETLHVDFYRTVKRRFCMTEAGAASSEGNPLAYQPACSASCYTSGPDRGAHTTFVDRLTLQYLH